MTVSHSRADVCSFLEGIATELAAIHRGKHYALWRDEAKHRVNDYLAAAEPFAEVAHAWVFSGDGAGAIVGGRFGEWAIDRLVEHLSPTEVLAAFEREIERNSATYEDISPVIGIELKEHCELADGISLFPPSSDIFSGPDISWRFRWPQLPAGTGFLVQRYRVTPAFEARPADALGPLGTSVTDPPFTVREIVRRRFRLACLLASAGAVELPLSVTAADRQNLLAIGGSIADGPFAAQPVSAFPADLGIIAQAFDQLATFAEGDSLTRAIDRLGRSRLAVHPVDRALDLGMAAEIVLMHDQGGSNTEITYKIASRAAWLLGSDADDRADIFAGVKQLYGARSEAVHSGVLSRRSAVDLNSADTLVVRVFRAVLARGGFPDWATLTLGAG
jgi:hypothetical protein